MGRSRAEVEGGSHVLSYYKDSSVPYRYTCLVFSKSWIGTKLPDQWEHPLFGTKAKAGLPTDQMEHFLVELLDTEDGKVYKIRTWSHYELPSARFKDTTVHTYMYREHYCSCHRKADARSAGADTDEECEGERFVVQSITAPEHLPGLVLYSETRTAKELETTPAFLELQSGER